MGRVDVRAAAGWAAGLAAALAVLWIPRLGPYPAYLGTEILIAALFAQAFNLLFGHTGLLSFGQAAFFGIGAYTVAIMLRDVTTSLAVAMGAAVVAATLAAAIIGYLSVRRDEIFFAMLTLSFGMMVYTVVYQWRAYTGGSDGLTGFSVPDLVAGPLRVDLNSIEGYYYFTLFAVSLSTWLLWRVTRSPFGQVLAGIRENPQRMAFLGVHVARYRLAAFVVSGLFTGVAGALMSPFEHIASPVYAHWTKSAEPVLMTLLGGSRVFLGPAVGAAIFLYLHNVVTQYTDHWEVVLGAILLVLILFFPQGVTGTLASALSRASGAKRASSPAGGMAAGPSAAAAPQREAR